MFNIEIKLNGTKHDQHHNRYKQSDFKTCHVVYSRTVESQSFAMLSNECDSSNEERNAPAHS